MPTHNQKTQFVSYVDVGVEESADNSLVLAISQVVNDMDCQVAAEKQLPYLAAVVSAVTFTLQTELLGMFSNW